jgi:cytochrome c-type biogenesis protein CcmH
MMRRLIVVLLCLLPAAAMAGEATPLTDDPVLEQRVQTLSAELRCLVCQNQSLADSHADLAVDLRNQVRALIKTGKSDAEIKTWLTERYGDFVLYRPPVKSSTWLLWFGPFLLLAVAVAGLLVYLSRRRGRTPPPALSGAESARAQALLHTTGLPGSADPGSAAER